MSVHPTVQVRRIYAEPASDDGVRVLVDRLWPRGISKSKAHLDEWCQQVAPSTQLRTWYRHDPAKFFEFASRYREELGEPERADALAHLRDLAQQPLTLLTASKLPAISEAAVLADLLTSQPTTTTPPNRPPERLPAAAPNTFSPASNGQSTRPASTSTNCPPPRSTAPPRPSRNDAPQ
ncbi:Uncharacterized conserved protein YeaO, DUF488 family [Nakamurella panacisegetis]|uniref:Uncharacterized conserved protein YeaO, DUF488 family n=1 Tax=Nakamurella panacisegetis TaxID=1090615 RepID=A0A1H0RJL5_9ACTN|nr:DUF488 family protein [Nakamurella panacisegetis]SDP29727.1 Uncharacterized conserved protein YeaO, DUF488 family [Nakamurella panacisegetis]